MRRIICCILIALFIISCTAGCDEYDYDGWQTIYIEDVGLLKIPSDWKSYVEDEYLYIVDADDKPVLIQTKSFYNPDTNEPGIVESNKFVDNIQCIGHISSNVLSNSPIYGKKEFLQNSEKSERYFLDLSNDMQLIFWDPGIDEEMVKKIAASFDGSNDGYIEYKKTGDGLREP